VLHFAVSPGGAASAPFRREAAVLAQVNHPDLPAGVPRMPRAWTPITTDLARRFVRGG
jgi:hypothetical protein